MSPDPASTWGIAPVVRKILSKRILELRGLLEDDIRRQLASLGITAEATAVVPGGRVLSADDARAREVAAAVIGAAIRAGSSREAAFDDYVRETAFTYLNRTVGLRCLEERGLLIVGGQPETVIKVDPVRGVASLAWRIASEQPELSPREVAQAAFQRACAAITERIAVLFDPASDHAVLFPLQATISRVSELLNDPAIPASVYAEDEVMGWVYQYWNSEEKDRVYAKLGGGGKIETPEELSAASTLYTERYIVDYLLQNTLGALWTELRPDTRLRETWPYYVTPPEDNEIPKRGPKRVRDLTLLDPAVGSGHFLVRAFDLFRQLYEEEGTEDPAKVPSLILERNLFGIDIDTRATQIAALALYAKAASAKAEITGDRAAPFTPRRINLVSADITLPPGDPPADLLAELPEPELLELATALWTSLQGARDFGSLLHPERTINEAFAKLKARDRDGIWAKDDQAWTERRRTLIATLERVFEREADSPDLGQHLFGQQARRGLSFVQALRRRYDVVVANPPYAGGKSLDRSLASLLAREYPAGKADIYAAFILRALEFSLVAGGVGLVTQQSWMHQKIFSRFREVLLSWPAIQSIADLGSGAFAEISGDVVRVAAVCLANAPARQRGHRISAFRLVGISSAADKAAHLRVAIADLTGSNAFQPVLEEATGAPGKPILYSLPPQLLLLIAGKRRRVELKTSDGLGTRDEDRFVRYFWEAGSARDWRPYAKGGGYKRWVGFDRWVVDWTNSGEDIRENIRTKYPYFKGNVGFLVRDEDRYFTSGLTYSDVGQGCLSVRLMDHAAFSDAGPGIFSNADRAGLIASLNSRLATFLLRSVSPGLMHFRGGYFYAIPLDPDVVSGLTVSGRTATTLKAIDVAFDPLDRRFFRDVQAGATAAGALLHAVEGRIERVIFDAYDLGPDDVQAVIDETGTPAGWHPLIAGYHTLPEPPDGTVLPDGLTEFLATLEHRTLSGPELAKLKGRLRTLYEAGPGAKVEADETATATDEEADGAALGARIPIPTETFLEELSQKLEVHPISVHWLLTELREQEGVVSPPVRMRELDDYLQVTILRILGYRWPEQDAYEAEHGPLLPPDLVDPDGIVPLVPIDDQTTMADRIRDRIERQFGEAGSEVMLRDIKRYLKRDLDDWLKRDFFKSHIPRFKQRPIAWHLTSPAGEFAALVLYHRLSRQTLERLRAQYAGDRIKRLRAELARAESRDQPAEASRLRAAIEDVEEFQARIEAIERGSSLAARIRCRWKDEEADGRPGPYTPDIDDGVKVNIRPFQELGLFPVKMVVRKW